MVNKLNNITSIPDIYNIGVSAEKSEEEINFAINEYINSLESTLTKTNQQVIHSPNLDFFDFLGIVKLCINTRQASEGISENKRILFYEDLSDEITDTETISFVFSGRFPGQFDQAPLGRGTVREHSAHIRSSVQHPSEPGQKLLTFGRFYEDHVTFHTYAETVRTALKRAFWFQKVIDSFLWCFKIHGFTVQFQKIGMKERKKIGERHLIRYPISYLIRKDETFHLTKQELRNVLINLNVSKI